MPGTCECVFSHGKWTLQRRLNLESRDAKVFLDYLGGPSIIRKGLIKKEGDRRVGAASKRDLKVLCSGFEERRWP